jgi:hypothetical protein
MLQVKAIILKSPFHVALYSEYTSELTFKNATQALQNATTALSDAATAAENAVIKTEDEGVNEQEGHSSGSPSNRIPAPDLEKDLPSTQPHPANPKSEDENAVIRTEDEDANKQKEHSSTSPSSRMPAPDQATLQKTLPSTQPQPANPRSEEPVDIPAVASLFRGTLDDDQDSDLTSMQPQPQPSPKPEEAEPTPAATVGTTHEENSNTTSGPALNEGAENSQPANEDSEYAKMEPYELRKHVSELMITLWNEGVIVVPPIIWDGESGPAEKLAMERAGFLFSMYQVSHTRARVKEKRGEWGASALQSHAVTIFTYLFRSTTGGSKFSS